MTSRLDPKVDLKIVADWGNANFHAMAGLVAAHMRWRSAPGSTFWIRTGTGYRDNIGALMNGEVDVAITTPFDVTADWAINGSHYFSGTPFPGLRALGYFPHDDRLVFAVRADTGITSFEDIRRKKPALTIATTVHHPDNMMTWVVDLVLEKHGIKRSDIEAWGGGFVEHDHPRICLPMVTNGTANAVFNEGIMVPQWHELVEKVPMRFIPMEEGVLARLKQEYGLKPALLPKGRLGADRDVPCLDWSHWAVVTTDKLDPDLAYRITAVMVEERAEFEARYRSLPLDRSPLTYPIDPRAMWKDVGAPLHPGAERYYREHGYMP